MTRTRWIWLISTAFYVVFFSWYTSFGGPLTEAEIGHYMVLMESREPAPAPERLALLRKFMEEDTGDDFVMVNVIDMYETPLQVEGVEPGETSDEVLAKYMDFMIPELFARACHPVLYGRAANSAMDLMNADGMEQWTAAGATCWRLRPIRRSRALTTSRSRRCARRSPFPSTRGSSWEIRAWLWPCCLRRSGLASAGG
jgi:hypothetical protein